VTLEIAVLALALALLVGIVETLRRRRLSENYALVWLGAGVFGLLLGIARPFVDRLSSAIGIVYGTSLVFALAIVFLVLVCINLSVHISRLEQRVEVLAQEVALLSVAEEGEGPPGADPSGDGLPLDPADDLTEGAGGVPDP
jgi:hypothetical protein